MQRVAAPIRQPAPTTLRTEWVTSPAAIDALADVWSTLESAAAHRTSFATFDFLGTWYRHYAGEYGGTPLVGLAWSGTHLVGVAPLTMRHGTLGRIPVTRVDFAPNDSIAGECLLDDRHPGAFDMLLESLLRDIRFDILCLNGFTPASAPLATVHGVARRHHWAVELEDHAFAIVDLRDGYPAYRNRLSSHYRRNLNAKARKIEAAGAAVDGVFLEAGVEQVDAAVERMIAINEASYKLQGQRLADHHRAFLSDMCRRLAAQRRLALTILSIGRQDAAYFLGVIERGCCYDITLAYAERFARLSPGAHLTQLTLERLAAAGVHTMVSHGAHEYKKHWATTFVPQTRVYLFTRRPRVVAARLVRFRLLPLWRRIARHSAASALCSRIPIP